MAHRKQTEHPSRQRNTAKADHRPHTATQGQSLVEREAAAYLGMSRAWLRQSRMRNTGPAYIRAGRSVRYRVADLDAWLSAHRVATRDSGTRPPREAA